MRAISYLSPTSLNSFRKNPKKFYQDYLAETRSVREPQSGAMSVGSAFDAYVKSALVTDLFGEATGKFDFETLFTAQVSAPQRDFARQAGKHCFEAYKRSGAYGDLFLELKESKRAPRFEFTGERVVGSDGNDGTLKSVGGVPFLGKPDLDFQDRSGDDVTCDWKVNGYCSKSPPSPGMYHAICRDGWDHDVVAVSRNHGTSHKLFVGSNGVGLRYHTGCGMEEVNEEWAVQLAIYGWLGGSPVGAPTLGVIEQLCCDASKPGINNGVPLIRIASIRARITPEFQERIYREAVAIWGFIQSGWIFRDMPEDQSRALQESMDRGVVLDEDTAFLSEKTVRRW